jgi:hypothetical protein
MLKTPILDGIVNKSKRFNFEKLISLIEETMTEQTSSLLTTEEKNLITDDFYINTLTEIFSGIDYSKFDRSSINENKNLKQLLREQEEVTGEEVRLGLPKLRISEDWGKPESRDREIINRFTASIPGDTLQEKLEHINRISTTKVQMASIGQILGVMVVVEVLSTILAQYTESAGGFIFEGFLAGLFGKDSVQITDVPEGEEATGKPITDVELGGRQYSLKLLGPTTAVKGSWRNMVEHFNHPKRDHVVYLDARRSGKAASDSLVFGEFLITLPNFMEIFYEPWKGYEEQETQVSTKKELLKTLKKHGDQVFGVQFDGPVGRVRSGAFKLRGKYREDVMQKMLSVIETLPDEVTAAVNWSKEDPTKSTKATWLFGSGAQFNAVLKAIKSGDKELTIEALQATDGYTKKRQFEFTKNQAESIGNFQEIAHLLLGEEQLKKTWVIYGDILRKTVTPVYTHIARFNENVSKYFMGTADGDARKEYAIAAQADLTSLKEATDEAISEVERTGDQEPFRPETLKRFRP